MSNVDLWASLVDVIILLLAALVLGAICERFKQSAILGYLLAGTLLGPNALNWISNEKEVEALAELGVALLLFTIGLEFSWGRLRRLGTTALKGGSLQVIITLGLATGAAMVMGLGLRPAIVVGAVIALSSTAGVLRVLVARAEMESVRGRHADRSAGSSEVVFWAWLSPSRFTKVVDADRITPFRRSEVKGEID